jgi:hypothetical protein
MPARHRALRSAAFQRVGRSRFLYSSLERRPLKSAAGPGSLPDHLIIRCYFPGARFVFKSDADVRLGMRISTALWLSAWWHELHASVRSA